MEKVKHSSTKFQTMDLTENLTAITAVKTVPGVQPVSTQIVIPTIHFNNDWVELGIEIENKLREAVRKQLPKN